MFGHLVTPTACRPTWRSGPGRRQIVWNLAAPSPDDSVLAQPGTRFGGEGVHTRVLGWDAMDGQAALLFPTHGGPHFPVEVCGDLLPGLQAFPVWGCFAGGHGVSEQM